MPWACRMSHAMRRSVSFVTGVEEEGRPKVDLPLDPLSPVHGTRPPSSPPDKGTNFWTPDKANSRANIK